MIEDRRGGVVGIEVEASATVKSADFAGLRRLAEATGDKFVLGLALYDHDLLVPFGDRLWAAPLQLARVNLRLQVVSQSPVQKRI